MIYYPESYGAVGNGCADDGNSIQLAIDSAAARGGGTVVLQSGKVYYSHSIIIKENVELHLQKGSVLKATSVLEDYFRPCEMINDPDTALVGNPVTGKPSFAFIYGFKADNCTISGEGVIDANCYAFVERKSKYYVTGNFYPRPTVIYIENSKYISFKDITIKNSPFWTLHPAGCYDVLIEHIRILNPLDVANSDGIDPDHCENVRILGCHIECADDCICLKNSMGNAEYGECKNIIINGCTLVSTSAAIKIGTEGIDNFKNIYISNCIISRSNRGLSIQIRDCGNVENVNYTDISIETRRFSPDWWGCAEPIAITVLPRDEFTNPGKVKDVLFRNIRCRGENGVLIFADDKNAVSGVKFENVDVDIVDKTNFEKDVYDLRPCYNHDVLRQNSEKFFVHNAVGVTIT